MMARRWKPTCMSTTPVPSRLHGTQSNATVARKAVRCPKRPVRRAPGIISIKATLSRFHRRTNRTFDRHRYQAANASRDCLNLADIHGVQLRAWPKESVAMCTDLQMVKFERVPNIQQQGDVT